MSRQIQKISSRDAANISFEKIAVDVKLLLKELKGRDQTIVELIYTTGINPSELVELRKSDLVKGQVLVRPSYAKNNQGRQLKVSRTLFRKLVELVGGKQPDSHIFCSRQSPKLTTRRIEQIFSKASKKAQLEEPITARDLRNSFLSKAAQIAKTDEDLKEFTGLKSITKKSVLSNKEIKRLNSSLEKQGPRNKALVQILLKTGIGLSSALDLQKKQVKEQKLIIQDREVPISKSLYRTLQSILEKKQPEDYLFSSRQSPKLTTRRAEQIVENCGVKAKISNLTPSLLRATAISELAKDLTTQEIAARTGLQSPLFYTHGIVTSKEQTAHRGGDL